MICTFRMQFFRISVQVSNFQLKIFPSSDILGENIRQRYDILFKNNELFFSRRDYLLGDECQLVAGRYHEEVKIDGLKGEKDKLPFVIRAYPGDEEKVIIDGTVLIDTKWEQYDKNIYK